MSVVSAEQRFNDLAEELNDLLQLDAQEFFYALIGYEKELAPLQENEYVVENYVHGCISNAYVVLEEHDQKVRIRGHSEAKVVSGLMGVLASGFSEMSKAELAQHGKDIVGDFIRKISLSVMLTPTRANAFGNIIDHIVRKAGAGAGAR